MKRRRFGYVAVGALAITAVLLGIRAVQLRRQLARAEYYAQSGVDSYYWVCTGVTFALREFPDVSYPLLHVAERCMGEVRDPAEARARVNELATYDHKAIARRIEERIAERTLPLRTNEAVTSSRLPKGYEQRD